MTRVVDLAEQVFNYISKPEWRIIGESRVYQYLSEAEKIVAYFKPEATAKDIYFTCQAGAKQDVSSSTESIERLILIKRNGNANNPGDALIKTTREDLQKIAPGWESKAAQHSAYHYMYDPELEPKIFYLYPPVENGSIVNFTASITPGEYGTVNSSTESNISSVFDPALVHYAVACCYKFDPELDPNKGVDHMNLFMTLIGVKSDSEMKAARKARLPQ